jgi:hypothetical protein
MRIPLGATLILATYRNLEFAMSVSARLSRSLHRVLGDEGAEDLVNWMVAVETTRSDLNEVMVAWRAATDARFAAIDVRFDGMDRRFDAIDRRLESMDRRMTDLFKWSFVFWLGSVGVFAGLVRLMR